jgi:hypothetical protein
MVGYLIFFTNKFHVLNPMSNATVYLLCENILQLSFKMAAPVRYLQNRPQTF